MNTRHALLVLGCLLTFIGCGTSGPVTPPPQPVATAEPVVDPVAKPADPTDPASPQQSVTDLIGALSKESDRQAAAVALAAHGKDAVPALTKALDHTDWQVRAAAVFALGQMGNQAAAAKTRLQTIAEKDENASVRDAAAFALDGIEGK